MPDPQLESRAGLNIGNSPVAGLLYAAKVSSKSVEIPTNGSQVTLYEGVEGVLRVPATPGGFFAALSLINASTSQSYDWTMFFIDDEGNQMEIESGSINEGLENVEIELGEEGVFALCPGEKIVMSAVAGGTF